MITIPRFPDAPDAPGPAARPRPDLARTPDARRALANAAEVR